jgi:hypothetical protein
LKLKRVLLLALALALAATAASAATTTKHRRTSSSRAAAQKSAAAARTTAALQTARDRISGEIKTLTHFLYLYGGISKGIESADVAIRTRQASSTAIDQGEQNKARVRDSLKNVRVGLEKLETDLRADPALKNYYPYVTGVANIAQTAESQATASHFDDAGRSLLKAVDRLTEALALMR